MFQAKYKGLDFRTVDKLCEISTKKEFEFFCDCYFHTDSEIEPYCREKNIPYEEYEENNSVLG